MYARRLPSGGRRAYTTTGAAILATPAWTCCLPGPPAVPTQRRWRLSGEEQLVHVRECHASWNFKGWVTSRI